VRMRTKHNGCVNQPLARRWLQRRAALPRGLHPTNQITHCHFMLLIHIMHSFALKLLRTRHRTGQPQPLPSPSRICHVTPARRCSQLSCTVMVMMHTMDHAQHVDTTTATLCIKPRKPAHPPRPNLVPTAAIKHLQQLTCPPCTAARSSQHSAPMLHAAQLPDAGAQPGCARCSCSAQTAVFLPHPSQSRDESATCLEELIVRMATIASSDAGITAT
jgi:hypothetical protein